MKYSVTIITPLGFSKSIDTDNKSDFLQYKKEAHDRVVKCLPWNQYDESIRHLVYYYEIEWRGQIEVRIEMNPRGVDDDTFDTFVKDFSPIYVGAIHRH